MFLKNYNHKHKKIKFGFLVHVNITSWIIFIHFKYIGLALDSNYFILKETSTNIYKLKHMKYICVEIIHHKI